MKIESFEINNFRSLKNAKFEGLDNLVILIGQSGGGKTSIFEALEIFFSNVNAPSKKLELNDRYWFNRDTYKPIIFDVQLSLDITDTARLSEPAIEWVKLEEKKGPGIRIKAEINYSSNGNTVWKLVQPNIDKMTQAVKQSTPQKPPEAESGEAQQSAPIDEPTIVVVEKTSREIELDNWTELLSMLVDGFQWIRGSRFTMSDSNGAPDKARHPYIPQDAQNELLQLKNSDAAVDVETYAKIRRAFDGMFKDGRLDFDNQFAFVYEGVSKYPVNLLGSGQQSYLFVLLEILKRGFTVIGVEEPETHLDPRLQKILFSFLRDRKNQVFIISHSPLFIEKQGIESNWALTKDGLETKVERIKDATGLKKVLDDLGSRPADLLHANTVLMVEGQTEEALIPSLLIKLGGNPNLPGLRVVRLHGKEDKQTARAWISMSKDTQTEVFLLVDEGAKELVAVARDAGLSDLNIHEIKGTIEDTYPQKYVDAVLQEIFRVDKNPKKQDGKPVDPIDIKQSRVSEINRYFKEAINVSRKDFWKITLGNEIANRITEDEIDATLRRFLGRVIQSSVL